MRRSSNCLRQFLLAAVAASQRTSMSPKRINVLEECPKCGHSSHGFEMPQSGIIEVSVNGAEALGIADQPISV